MSDEGPIQHNISNPPNAVPRQWVYLIKPPNESIGGIDFNDAGAREFITAKGAEGFMIVKSDVYDEFLRQCRERARRDMDAAGFTEYLQQRYDIQRAKVFMLGIETSDLTWGEWEEYMPSSIGYTSKMDRTRWPKLVDQLRAINDENAGRNSKG